MSSPVGRCSRRSARGRRPTSRMSSPSRRSGPADERDGELWLTGRPRRGEDDEEARTLAGALRRHRGRRSPLLALGSGARRGDPAVIRRRGRPRDRLGRLLSRLVPVLRPQPVVPEAERTARAADEWMREVLRRLEGERFNVITLKWWGRPREAPTFAERHGVSGTFIAASRFMHGLARSVGLEPLEAAESEDATADLARRVDLVRERLDAGDTFVFSHQKATDEAGHTRTLRSSSGRSRRSTKHSAISPPIEPSSASPETMRRLPIPTSSTRAIRCRWSWQARESAPTESPPSASCPAPQAFSAICEALTSCPSC